MNNNETEEIDIDLDDENLYEDDEDGLFDLFTWHHFHIYYI